MTQDIMIWIGNSYYSTRKAFIDEARELGVSRRINQIPSMIIPGKSRAYLVHSQINKNGDRERPVVFAYFTISNIDMIVTAKGTDLVEELRARGLEVKELTPEEVVQEKKRGCGDRLQVGAMYIVTSGDIRQAQDLAKEKNIKGALVLIEPVEYNSTRFQGWKYAESDSRSRYA